MKKLILFSLINYLKKLLKEGTYSFNENKMKILHLWNLADVAFVLKKYQENIYGHKVSIFKKSGFDPYRIGQFYNHKDYIPKIFGTKEYYFLSILKSMVPEVIHINGLFEIIPYIKRLRPSAKIIFEYHGTAHVQKIKPFKNKLSSLIDKEVVCSPDLLDFVPNAELIVNPINTEHFKQKKLKNEKYFMILQRDWSEEKIKQVIKKRGFNKNFEVIRTSKMDGTKIIKDQGIFYKDLPNFFYNYGGFIDIKLNIYGDVIKALSLMGIQALSCGLKVVSSIENTELQVLPEEFKPENVCKKWEKVYEEIGLNKK